MEVDDRIHTDKMPRLGKLETTLGDLVKDILSFKKNIGADVTKRLQKLEGLMQSFEVAAGVGSNLVVNEIRA
jgi:hypothetical protein